MRGGDWQELSVPLAVEGHLVHVRLFPPVQKQPVEIDWIEIAPAGAGESADEEIKYFSGSGVYRKTFTLPDISDATSLKLDLGQVDVMARVKLNGKDLGLLWCQPFQVDIGKAAKPGKNSLEIEVTNLWINRLIGDAVFPYKKFYNQIVTASRFPPAVGERPISSSLAGESTRSKPTHCVPRA